MVEKSGDKTCCMTMEGNLGICKVESVISIDDRGQMVLPKGIRDRAIIRPGDKMAVTSWEKDGEICCISLIKVENLANMVKELLGPVMKEILAG
ncbi:MAG: AbrB/MazE/SpoVT family DNA-binding domain-containing protein [Deltaproteobacteria bacterium]|nr:AbrB/MazE/SpoVT family DNA-binding domain-containing protein [Deltaproteobacteria bacterium]